MRLLTATTDLPTALFREIGRVIVAYANLEHRLSAVIHTLLGLDPKRGRLAVREPRASDRVEIIKDLIELADIPVSVDLKVLMQTVDKAQRERDWIAHGLWLSDPKHNAIRLRLTKAQWQPVKGQRGKTKRVLKPESIQFGIDECRTLQRVIFEAIDMVDTVRHDVQSGRSL